MRGPGPAAGCTVSYAGAVLAQGSGMGRVKLRVTATPTPPTPHAALASLYVLRDIKWWLTFVCEKRVALNPVAHSIRAKDADESDNSLQEEQKTQMDEHTPITAQYFTYPDRLTAACISACRMDGWSCDGGGGGV